MKTLNVWPHECEECECHVMYVNLMEIWKNERIKGGGVLMSCDNKVELCVCV